MKKEVKILFSPLPNLIYNPASQAEYPCGLITFTKKDIEHYRRIKGNNIFMKKVYVCKLKELVSYEECRVCFSQNKRTLLVRSRAECVALNCKKIA